MLLSKQYCSKISKIFPLYYEKVVGVHIGIRAGDLRTSREWRNLSMYKEYMCTRPYENLNSLASLFQYSLTGKVNYDITYDDKINNITRGIYTINFNVANGMANKNVVLLVNITDEYIEVAHPRYLYDNHIKYFEIFGRDRKGHVSKFVCDNFLNYCIVPKITYISNWDFTEKILSYTNPCAPWEGRHQFTGEILAKKINYNKPEKRERAITQLLIKLGLLDSDDTKFINNNISNVKNIDTLNTFNDEWEERCKKHKKE
jgi:hypothetical protein